MVLPDLFSAFVENLPQVGMKFRRALNLVKHRAGFILFEKATGVCLRHFPLVGIFKGDLRQFTENMSGQRCFSGLSRTGNDDCRIAFRQIKESLSRLSWNHMSSIPLFLLIVNSTLNQ